MCIFCQIVAGEIPSYKVYEDERVLVFLDIKPVHQGHLLVIPKKHVANLEEVSADDLQALILVVQKMGWLLKERLGYPAYNVSENNDPLAGQEVPHLHFHLIPRLAGDGLAPWRKEEYAPGEMEEVLKKLTD